MTLPLPVKAPRPLRGLVGVLASPRDLIRASALRRPPDFFELRLDRLPSPDRDQLRRLARPFIITARHPAEGGSTHLAPRQRAKLLRDFFPLATAIDLELRALRELRAVWRAAATHHLARILSLHDFVGTPSTREFARLLDRAERLAPEHLKVVTRVETRAALARLLDFFDEARARLPVSAMGLGRFGRESRLALHARGSLLHYVHLGQPVVSGQLSLAEARRLPPAHPIPG